MLRDTQLLVKENLLTSIVSLRNIDTDVRCCHDNLANFFKESERHGLYMFPSTSECLFQ